MIGFYVNNRWLELPVKFVFSQTKKSPVWFGGSLDSIPGNYTLPATISAESSVNRLALGFPEFLNNWQSFGEEIDEAEVWIGGNFYDRGRLFVSLANPKNYKIQFVSGAGALKNLKEKTLQDYDYGTLNFPGTVQGFWDYMASTSNSDYETMFPTFYKKDEEATAVALTNFALHPQTMLTTIFTNEGYHFSNGSLNPETASLCIIGDKYLPYPQPMVGNVVAPKRNFAPPMLVSNLLKELRKLWCVAYDFNTYNKQIRAVFQKDLLDLSQAVDLSELVTSEVSITGKPEQIKLFSFKTLSDSENTEKLLDYTLRTPVNTIADLPSGTDGDVCYVWERGAYFRYNFGEWKTDDYIRGVPPVGIHPDGKVSIESNFIPVELDVGIGNGMLNPVKVGDLNYYTVNKKGKPVEEAQIGYSRGAQPSLHPSYPEYNHVTWTNRNREGDVAGNTTLAWHGDDGLLATYWNAWLAFLSNAVTAEVEMLWRMRDLFEFDFFKPVVLWDAHSGGYHYFFVAEQKIVVDMFRIKKAVQKVVQVRNLT